MLKATGYNTVRGSDKVSVEGLDLQNDSLGRKVDQEML